MKTLWVLVMVALLVSCAEQGVVKVGVIATLTGVGSYQGQQELRGLELARDEINSAGGINGKRIEFIVEDSRADPATATNAFNKLISVDNVRFVIGDSWVSTTAVLVPIANENNVLLMSPVCSLNSLSQDDFFFRTMPSVKDMMVPLADYAYNVMGSRRVAVLAQKTAFGAEHSQYFKQEFERIGGIVVGEESFPLAASDVRTEITKVADKHPDTILDLHATGPMTGLLVKQAKELGVDVMWLSSFGTENVPLLSQYGSVIDGMVYPYPYDGGSSEFNAAYKGRFNESSDLIAANSYDAMKLVGQAISNVGEDSLKAKEYLTNVRGYRGAGGMISFDHNGDVIKPVLIKVVKDGSFRTV